MTQHEALVVPLLDSAVLDRLQLELDYDEGVWKVFIQDFVALLPARIERVRMALTTGDPVTSKDAALSLKTASQMVGAERLAGLTLDLELAIRNSSPDGPHSDILPRLAVAHLPRLRQCAQQTIHLLERHLRGSRA
ncbi:Hpt domain-containing protein [Pseudarthrobacter sp. BIM B-2242]|uniref:Hpt domain-containing protein n=1 Tax=Pseudarthrobacter sp. BIM B-2242 TaxID=2772401 RepID=UPI00168B2AE4|nr:Hpt domain-containing protein [Pseudarthrobacter sp. BIM B-2242]QOD02608.1 Hpt domain-containing protein [Pseudarthrobacter sp. BIM B-2242]